MFLSAYASSNLVAVLWLVGLVVGIILVCGAVYVFSDYRKHAILARNGRLVGVFPDDDELNHAFRNALSHLLRRIRPLGFYVIGYYKQSLQPIGITTFYLLMRSEKNDDVALITTMYSDRGDKLRCTHFTTEFETEVLDRVTVTTSNSLLSSELRASSQPYYRSIPLMMDLGALYDAHHAHVKSLGYGRNNRCPEDSDWPSHFREETEKYYHQLFKGGHLLKTSNGYELPRAVAVRSKLWSLPVFRFMKAAMLESRARAWLKKQGLPANYRQGICHPMLFKNAPATEKPPIPDWYPDREGNASPLKFHCPHCDNEIANGAALDVGCIVQCEGCERKVSVPLIVGGTQFDITSEGPTVPRLQDQ